MDDYLENFYLGLQDRDFEANESKTLWTGQIIVEWEDKVTEELKTAEHAVVIHLQEGFPYRAPTIYSQDKPPLIPSWHLTPGDLKSLCLWDSTNGWQPAFTAHKLLKRIYDWFYYYHTDTWPTNSQVPDLHLYLQKVGTIIIGEEWCPLSESLWGPFTLWQSKYSTVPYVATSDQEHDQAEPRIADNILLESNPKRLQGVWFRVPQPFVPASRLDNLLKQIDMLLQKPPGWSTENCIKVIGKKTASGAFPLAIGYIDHRQEERWLFLWGQFPERKGIRFRWSSPQNLGRISVKSFQTALASKEALLRRSAYLSKNLTSKHVALFGVGALGSSIALLLAKAGVGEIRLVDSDNLMPGNIVRHICGLDRVGFAKTRATQYALNRHNPDCYVECFEASWNKNTLTEYIQNCHLVVDATGNTNFSLHLNNICVEKNQPVLFTTTYRRARIGRVIIRSDDKSPCLACYLNHKKTWSETEYPTIPDNPNESFIEDGCGAVTEEAVAIDVEAVANFTTRHIVKILQGTVWGGNLGLLVNEPLPDSESQILRSPGLYHWSHLAYPHCEICSHDSFLSNIR